MLLVWGAAVLALSASLATMNASAHGEDRKRKVVELVALGDGNATLVRTLRELVGRVGLTVRTISPGDEAFDQPIAADVLARVSVDTRGKGPAHIAIVDGRSGGIVSQRSLSRESSSGVAVEELALVVRWALDALAEGRPVPAAGPSSDTPAASPASDRPAALPTSEHSPAPPTSDVPVASPPRDKAVVPPASERPPVPPASERPPVPPVGELSPAPLASDQRAPPPGDKLPARPAGDQNAASPLPWALDLAMLGSARSFASGTGALMGVGGSAVFELGRAAGRPALWLNALYNVPVRSVRNAVEVDATLLSLRLAPSVAVFDSRVFVLDAGLGGGADVIHVTPTALGPSVQVVPNTAHFDPVACVEVTGTLRVSPSTVIEFSLEGDADLAPRRYVVATGEAHDPALDLLPLRIAGTVGFGFQVAGMDRTR